MAALIFARGHDELVVNFLCELTHMGNDTDGFAAASHLLQCIYCFLQGVFVQTAKALINKHGIYLHTANILLDNIR